MNVHQMRLHPEPFDKIKNGSKTIEIRLNDEKRQSIEIDDVIEFSLRPEPENIVRAEVTNLAIFKTFEKAYAAYPAEEYGAKTQDEWESMYQYYSREDEKKSGILAIQVETYKIGILIEDLKNVLQEKQGFLHVYDWYDKADTKHLPHSHKDKVTMYIVQGSVTFTFADEEIPLSFGACFDVPVGLEHTAKVGPEGCTYVVGEMIEGDS